MQSYFKNAALGALALSLCGAVFSNTIAQGPYFSLGMGYSHNVNNGDTSHVTIERNTNPNITLKTSNDRPEGNLQAELAGGYRYLLTKHISLGLGLALAHTHYDASGNGSLQQATFNTHYDYEIEASLIKPTVRLAYSTGHWSYFISGDVGASILRSQGYSSNSSAGPNSDHFKAHTTTNFLAGAEVGVSRYLSSQTSVGLSVAYHDLGDAKLGERVNVMGTNSDGSIEQKLNPVSVKLSITHWFG